MVNFMSCNFYQNKDLIFSNIYFWEREKDRDISVGEAESEGRQRILIRLRADSTELDDGLELMNHEIMTWAKIGHLTDWATQVPPKIWFLKSH